MSTRDSLNFPACTVDLTSRRAVFSDRDERLTGREVEVLRYMAERSGELVTRQMLEREVWGMSAGARSEAVPEAIRRLRKRIERNPKDPEALVTDYGHGWRLHPVRDAPPVAAPNRSLFGRSSTIESIESGWTRSRLQTLVGPGGAGKTTLAKAVSPPQSVFVDLAAAHTEADCLEALRAALPDLSLGVATTEAVLERVRHRIEGVPLVVLDNAEQALAPVGWLTRHLGNVRCLVTSRERLGVPGERVVTLPMLELEDATALFVQRFEDAGGTEVLDPELLANLAERLDRLPLAIELVAPRARILPLQALLERLDKGLDGLPSERGRDPRHRSLRRCLEWSWELLDDQGRDGLRAASTFAAPFELDALEAVLDADPYDTVAALCEASLLRVERPGVFLAPHLVRAFVSELGLGEDLVLRHATHHLERVRHLGHGVDRWTTLDALLPELRLIVGRVTAPDLIIEAGLTVVNSLDVAGLPNAKLEMIDLVERRLGHLPNSLVMARINAEFNMDPVSCVAALEAFVPDSPQQELEKLHRQHYLSRHGLMPAPDTDHWRALIDAADAPINALIRFAWHRAEAAPEEALAMADRAVRLSQGRVRDQVRAIRVREVIKMRTGGDEGSEDRIRGALQLAIRARHKVGVVACRHTLAVLLARHDREAADEAFAEAAEGMAAIGNRASQVHALTNQAINLWYLGKVEAADALLTAQPVDTLPTHTAVYVAAYQAVVAHGCGRQPAAAVETALDALETQGGPMQVLAQLLGAIVLRRPLRQPLEQLLEPLGAPPYTPDITSCLEQLRGGDRAAVGSERLS